MISNAKRTARHCHEGRDLVDCCKEPEWWNGRRSGLKIRGPVIGRTGSSPVSGTSPKLRKYLAQRR